MVGAWLVGVAAAGSWGKDVEPSWGSDGVEDGKRLSVQDPIVLGDLALFPVIDREASGRAELDVTTLGDGMARGTAAVRESANGVVDTLVVVNRSPEPLLVMAGDVVHGGMQDRVFQDSLLVAGGASRAVPVRCVERGRWTAERPGFVYAGRVDPALRAVVATGSQEQTWSAVAARNRATGAGDAASWLAGRDLDPRELAAAEQALAQRFADDKRVVGVVVARGGTFTGAEVYPHPALFAQDHLAVLSGQLAAAPATPATRLAGVPSK
ncbi:MAG: DUF6569 family protein, partial [Myxococcota bacterium]